MTGNERGEKKYFKNTTAEKIFFKHKKSFGLKSGCYQESSSDQGDE